MSPETLDLARLQFAMTAGVHFLFVALTLGLATIVACLQLRATIAPSRVHQQMVRFWGQLYVINYAMGIVTGLVMELQFGMSWSGLTHFAGDVFGSALAMETLAAFFLESTFLGLWIFGWGRINRWLHLATIWVVTLTAYASAYWILVANGLMQHPVGTRAVDGHLELTDLSAVLTNPTTVGAFWHILAGGLVTGGMVLAGVSAYRLRRRTRHVELFGRSLRIGVATALPALFVSATTGGLQFATLDEVQPMKLAAFGADAARVGMLRMDMVQRFGPGEYVPADAARVGAIIMLVIFALLLKLLFVSALLAMSKRIVRRFRPWHLLLTAALPLPFVAMVAGWVFREVGRQPWVVYGMLTVDDAVSPLSDGAMRAALTIFSVLFGVLVLVTVWLMARHVRSEPDGVTLGSAGRTADAATLISEDAADDVDDSNRVVDAAGASPATAVLTFVGR